MSLALIVIGIALVGGLLVLLLFAGTVFVFNPDRGRELFALYAGTVHSVVKAIFPKKHKEERPHRHHRRSDRIERGPHEHRRSLEEPPIEDTDRSLKLSHRAPLTRHSPARPTLAMTIRSYLKRAPGTRHSAEDTEGDR